MKNIIKFIILTGFVFSLISCIKDEIYDPLKSNGQLRFTDSSACNPKNDQYGSLLNKYVKKGLPGIVLLIKTPNEGLWVGSAGYACIETETKLQPFHLMNSASMAKLYCAVGIMRLVEQGKVALDAKMDNYLEQKICDKIANGNEVTISQLLTMHSGIPDYGSVNLIADGLFGKAPKDWIREDILEDVYYKDASYEPGEYFEYCGTNYILLAMIMENVTNKPYYQFFQDEIFEPLNLQDTYTLHIDMSKPSLLVNSYWKRTYGKAIENITDRDYYFNRIVFADGGVAATVYDYYQFLEALFKYKIIKEETVDEMMISDIGWKIVYGYGIMTEYTQHGYCLGHDGDGLGHAADMFYFPEDDITIVMATNFGTLFDTELDNEFQKKLWEEVVDIAFD